MTTNKLSEIKSQLQKFAQDIPTNPGFNDVNSINGNGNGNGVQGPEEVMELVDDAIEILEVAQEAIPAEKPGEDPDVIPTIGAKGKKRKAQTEDLNPEDDDPDKDKEKDARKRIAQDQETSENDERLDEEDTPEEDIEKKELTSRIKVLEAVIDSQKKAELADEFASLYPENVQQAKYDEIVNSKEKIATLQRDYKIAKELHETQREAKSYTPLTGSSGGYLKNIKRASRNETLPAWKV